MIEGQNFEGYEFQQMSVKTPEHSDQEEANGEEEDKKAEVTPITVQDMDGDD